MTDNARNASVGQPVEMEAVRTTIVGGRPPGSGKGLGDIPRGIEILIKKAAVDADFRRLLLVERAGAAAEIELVLTPTEAMMINAVASPQLEAIIDRTRVDPTLKPAFLGKAAAVMLVALGAAGVPTRSQVYNGVRANPPVTSTAQAAPREIAGAMADFPVAGAPASKPTTAPATTQASQPAPATQPEPPPAIQKGIRPDEVRPVRGISARPQEQPAPPNPAPPPATQPADAKQVQSLIRQLDDNDYKVRQAAAEQLARLMPGVADALNEALRSGKLSPEQQARIDGILATTRPARPTEVRLRIGAIPQYNP